MRIGHGYDIHKLTEARKLVVGGVLIPYELGALGHSDADVLVHAIIDSILGALNLSDIGEHFPDNSPMYKDINSILLLEKTGELLKNSGYKISNIDTTVILEKPKLSPYKEKMKEKIANALNIDTSLVSIKAKTKEGMDATGKMLAIEAHAVCLIQKI